MLFRFTLLFLLLLPLQLVAQDAFDTCPSKAFLIQAEPAVLTGVNLVTGANSPLTDDLGTTGKINALGFSVHDQFLYGWGYQAGTLIKIDKNYDIYPLTLDYTNAPDAVGHNYYVGDVSSLTNEYYFYRKNVGLFKTSLDPLDSNYLKVEYVTDAPSAFYDIAFHPFTGYGYSVDSSGLLWELNLETLTYTSLVQLPVSGVFGAVYFDVAQNVYISQNTDGKIYKIPLVNYSYENQVYNLDLDNDIDGDVFTYNNYPNNTNVNGTANNDAIYINNNLLGSGLSISGGDGHDVVILGRDSSDYTVVSQGALAYRVTWTNGKFLNLNGIEEIIYESLNDSESPTLEFFAVGPSSSNNDGARCATADIVDEGDDTVDYGDAPDSYKTSLASNGARHEVDLDGLYLGPLVNGEFQPLAIDTSDDGVSFVTNLEAGFRSLVTVNASQAGYLDAWLDSDQDGTFSSGEKVISSYQLSAGDNDIVFNVAEGAALGSTWMRFRASDSGGMAAFGGVVGGEVEDYQVTILDPGISTVYYPSQNDYAIVSYEDNWPLMGDFDFNDVVVELRTRIDIKDDNVKRYIVEGNLVASGAGYKNGFAVRFKNVNRSDVNLTLSHKEVNGSQVTSEFVDSNADELIVNIFTNIKQLYTNDEGCNFFRTEKNCLNDSTVPFRVELPLSGTVTYNDSPKNVFDPFVYATTGYYHGPFISSANARTLEIHLQDFEPTELFDLALLSQGDDASNGTSYFMTTNNFPFALELPGDWKHPLEHMDFLRAYPLFRNFVESNGVSNSDWYDSPDSTKIIDEE